jgi:hypothetical protein
MKRILLATSLFLAPTLSFAQTQPYIVQFSLGGLVKSLVNGTSNNQPSNQDNSSNQMSNTSNRLNQNDAVTIQNKVSEYGIPENVSTEFLLKLGDVLKSGSQNTTKRFEGYEFDYAIDSSSSDCKYGQVFLRNSEKTITLDNARFCYDENNQSWNINASLSELETPTNHPYVRHIITKPINKTPVPVEKPSHSEPSTITVKTPVSVEKPIEAVQAPKPAPVAQKPVVQAPVAQAPKPAPVIQAPKPVVTTPAPQPKKPANNGWDVQ